MAETIANGPTSSSSSSEKSTKELNQKSSVDFFGQLSPYLEKGIDLYTKLSPYINIIIAKIQEIWKILSPYYYKYQLSQYANLLLGFILLFFGGHFNMTISTFIAVKISGLPLIKSSWNQIKINYINAINAAHQDETARKYLDRDGDGQISQEEISNIAKNFFKGSNATKMEILTNLRVVFIAIDPQQVMAGVVGIWTAILTVLATLRSTFARDVALGVSIGEVLSKNISHYIKSFLSNLKNNSIDESLKKWIDFGIDLFFKVLGISIAFLLVRVTSCFHSAVRGANIITYNIFEFLLRQQLLSPAMLNNNNNNNNYISQVMLNIESNTFFVAIQYIITFYGFWWQASSGFTITSWILRLLLLPLTINEYVLSWLAAF